MNEIIKKVEEIVERDVEINKLNDEIKELKKMLKGFDFKSDGFDKMPKVFSDADEKKIQKTYDIFANQIKSMYIMKNFDKFAEYLSINHGIEISFSNDSPKFKYIQSKKKQQKFYDLYSNYFIEDPPKDANLALDKITNQMTGIIKEYKKESEPIKEELKILIENDPDYKPLTIKTLNKIIKKSKIKQEELTNIANEVESDLSDQMKAINLIEE